MAVKYAPRVTFVWSGSWCDGNDGVRDTVTPVAGDIPAFDGQSGDATLDEDSVAAPGLGAMIMNGYTRTLAFGNFDIDVDGDCSLSGIITVGTGILSVAGDFSLALFTILPTNFPVHIDGTAGGSPDIITHNSNTNGALTIEGTANIQAQDAAAWDSFTHTAGTYDPNSQAHAIGGSINYDGSGEVTQSGVWTLSGTLNSTWNSTTFAMKELIIAAGASVTLTGNTIFTKGFVNTTASVTGAFQFKCYNPAANDFLDMQGTIASNVIPQVFIFISLSNSGTIKGGAFLIVGTDDVLTQTGAVSVTSTVVRSGSATTQGTLILSGGPHSLGPVTAGQAGQDKRGILTLGGGVSMTSFAAVGTGVSGNSELNFANAFTQLTGTIDGIGVTSTSGTGRVSGGTIQDLTVTGHRLLALSCVNGGSNSGVNFGVPSTATGTSV